MAFKLLPCWLALAFAAAALPVAAQQPSEPLKQFLDDAERERNKKAVDDLIRRLEKPSAPPATPAQPAPPQPPPVAAPQPPPAAPKAPEAPAAPPAQPPVALPQPPPVPPPAGPPPTPPVAQPAPPAPQPPAPPVAAPKPQPPAGPSPPVPMDKATEMARRQQLPSVDLEVLFPFNGSAITPEAEATLKILGEALSDPRLRSERFIIAGHTDARGGAAYNLALSQARAEAVRRWLINTYKLDPRNLTARGFGKTQLKNRANPFADENRRVQIINWTSLATTPRRRR